MKSHFKNKGTRITKEAGVYLANKVEEFIGNLAVYAEEHTKSLRQSTIKAEHLADTLDKVSLVLKIYPKVSDGFKPIEKCTQMDVGIAKNDTADEGIVKEVSE